MKIDKEVISKVLGITSDGLDIESTTIEELWDEKDADKALCKDPNEDRVFLQQRIN